MRQRQQRVVTQARGTHQVAVVPTRAGYQHRALVRWCRPLAVQPAGLAVDAGAGHKVVMYVKHTAAIGTDIGQQTLRHQLAVATRKAQGRIVQRQVGHSLWRARLQTAVTKGVHMLTQDVFTQATRATVHQQQQVLLVDAKCSQRFGRVHCFHLLKLSKVVTPANGAQRGIKATGLHIDFQHGLRHSHRVVHGGVDVAHAPFQLVELHCADAQVGLPQRHAAANVVAHQGGVEQVC
jgi:hypothetical protein